MPRNVFGNRKLLTRFCGYSSRCHDWDSSKLKLGKVDNMCRYVRSSSDRTCSGRLQCAWQSIMVSGNQEANSAASWRSEALKCLAYSRYASRGISTCIFSSQFHEVSENPQGQCL